uniref:Uncharacterized protein n=1 Tax=Sexangularia sp. CB-2014 TaxID=1486929 RepID=A0A7S1VCU4_9EUKA
MSNTEANATAILQPLDTPLAYRENAYALTKLLQIMYARALSRRTSTHVVTLHPGCIRSNINDATVLADPAASSRNLYRTELLAPLASVVVRLAQSIIDTMWEHGSVGGRRVLWAALDRRVASGDHVHNFGQLNVWVGPQATDVAACDTVYDNTVELVARFDQ